METLGCSHGSALASSVGDWWYYVSSNDVAVSRFRNGRDDKKKEPHMFQDGVVEVTG